MAAPQTDLLLSDRTTLGVGGPAAGFARAGDLVALARCLEQASSQQVPVLVLGGGSNLLVADAGLRAHVVQLTDSTITLDPSGVARVGAGAIWDDVVAWACARDLAGIECLSGIPGLVGAAPIQNIGAYGQEVAEVITAVHALDRTDGSLRSFAADDCGFGYRTSRFKRGEADRWIVTGVDLALRPGAPPTLRYADLLRRAAALPQEPSLLAVRDLVLDVRRSKSMVLDPTDPNARSAGSFFTNPIVSSAPEGAPSWPTPNGVKVAAAWLIEQAGFARGYGDGPAGLSERHTLAIVNRGGATARDIAQLAATVRRGVRIAFGITLVPEPVFAGWLRPTIDDPTAVLDAIDSGDLE